MQHQHHSLFFCEILHHATFQTLLRFYVYLSVPTTLRKTLYFKYISSSGFETASFYFAKNLKIML